MRRALAFAAACVLAAPALAQAPVPADAAPLAAEPDPARLAAARGVVEQILPADERDQMVATMLAPMMANIRQALSASPQFGAAFGSDARMKAIVERFLERQNQRMLATLREELPGMIEAMTRAYARRFSMEDLAAYRAFFATPAGRRYMREASGIMSDPDVAGWQRQVMTRSMNAIPAEIAQLTDEVVAAAQSENAK